VSFLLGPVLIRGYSIGKLRYGHPALYGVLPEPWLPLKKGQSLTNNDRNGNHGPPKDAGDQAVVLTLRKRYSVGPRRGGRRQSPDSRRDVGSTSTGAVGPEVSDGSNVDPTVINNPWEDARPGARRSQSLHAPPLSHRLSYDHASGVIMLPDNGDWLEDDDDDDDDSDERDFETENGLENSVTESMLNEAAVLSSPTSPGPERRSSRYSTYYHHPERAAARRRQTIPGAFPPS
jgi:calcium permeable stress-gated cation channel